MTPRVGLMGASYVAASRMVPAFRRAEVPVVSLFDTDRARFDLWKDEGLEVLTSDLDDFLAGGIDVVYVSSRNQQHAEQAIAACRAGKHVILEKPMALAPADARAVLEAADAAGVTLSVNHHLPGSPLHATARHLVADGRIGRLLSARVNHAVLLPENLREWRVQDAPGAGVVFDITVHDASVLNPLFGVAPTRVSALGVSQGSWNTVGTRDAVMTTIEYPAGPYGGPGLAQTHDAFTVQYPGTSMEIHGDQGAIVIGDAMTQDTVGTVALHTGDGVVDIQVDCSQGLYDINVEAFLSALNGSGRPTATGADGLLALQVALAAEESLATGRTVTLGEIA